MFRAIAVACACLAITLWNTQLSHAQAKEERQVPKNGVMPDAANMIDQLCCGAPVKDAGHSLALTGTVTAQTLHIEIGSVREAYPVRTLAGKDATLTATFDISATPAPDPTTPILLEVEEIHNRQWQTFGYSVLVNGQETYFRTYEEQGAGPCHYFIKVDRAAVKDAKTLTISFVNRGAAAVNLSRVWAYADFFRLAEEEQIHQPLTILSTGPFDKPVPLEMKLGNFVGGTTKYAYNRDYGQIYAGMAKAAELGLPTQFSLTAWFSTCPVGPDGRGGYFIDPKYSQTVYRDGKLYPQYPNVWGNSFGYPSMTEPNINRFLDQTREDTCRAIQRRRAFMAAAGKPLLHLQLCSDIGPTYFADDKSDFSAFELEAAAKDGIRLVPEHLTPEMRLWRYKNLSRVFGRIADAYRRGVGRDSVLVDRGTVTLPDDQLSENLYTHPFIWVMKPVGDPRWLGWQTGVVNGMWTSGELGTPYRTVYDYLTARGKTGIVNMFSGNKDLERCRKWFEIQYQLGWRFATPFGLRPEVAANLEKLAGIGTGAALPPIHYERRLLDVFIENSESMGPPDIVAATENLTIGRGNGAMGLIRKDVEKPGTIIYKLDTSCTTPETQAVVYIEGRSLSKALSLAVGNGQGQWVPVESPTAYLGVDYFRPASCGGNVGNVALPRLANGAFPAQLKITFTQGSIQRVRVGIPWDRLTGHSAAYRTDAPKVAPPADKDLIGLADENWRWISRQATDRSWSRKETRTLSLWVQQRRMAELLLEQYRELGGQDAIFTEGNTMCQQSLYGSAYRRLIGEISQLLPAQYAVRGHGQLGRYPVQVRLPSDDDVVLVTLKSVQPECIEFTLDAEKPQSCTLGIGQLAKGKPYRLERIADNSYRILQAAGLPEGSTALQVVEGKADVQVTVTPLNDTDIPRHFKAVCATRDGLSNIVSYWPIGGAQAEYLVKIAKGSVIRRREVHAADWVEKTPPVPGDLCEVTLDKNGESSCVESVYGRETGVIKSFERPGFSADAQAGVLTLENGRRYELTWGNSYGTRLDTALLRGNPRQYNFDMLAAGLRPKQRVEVGYTPLGDAERPDRLLWISQPTVVVFEEKLNGGEDAWRKQAVEVVDVVYYKLTGTIPALRNKNNTHSRPGYLIYKITGDTPFGDTAVHIFGRTIIDERNKFEVFTSLDRQTWQKCGEISSLEQLDPSHMMVDLSACAHGRKEFYLKVQITGTGDWCTIWGLEVRTEKQ
jgi:hypothetical protein